MKIAARGADTSLRSLPPVAIFMGIVKCLDKTVPSNQTRYFIGIALPENLSEQLFDFKRLLHKDIDYSLKPLVPHITLLHPFNLRTIPHEKIIPQIRTRVAPYLPLTFAYGDIEHFENTVLYIRIHSPELQRLQQELLQLLPPEAQTFRHQQYYIPHITLAQATTAHTLDIETLKKRAHREISPPSSSTINYATYFTQIRPREYEPKKI